MIAARACVGMIHTRAAASKPVRVKERAAQKRQACVSRRRRRRRRRGRPRLQPRRRIPARRLAAGERDVPLVEGGEGGGREGQDEGRVVGYRAGRGYALPEDAREGEVERSGRVMIAATARDGDRDRTPRSARTTGASAPSAGVGAARPRRSLGFPDLGQGGVHRVEHVGREHLGDDAVAPLRDGARPTWPRQSGGAGGDLIPSREAIASASSLALSRPIFLAMSRTTCSSWGLSSAGTLSQLDLLKTIAPMKGATLIAGHIGDLAPQLGPEAGDVDGADAGGVHGVGVDLEEEVGRSCP